MCIAAPIASSSRFSESTKGAYLHRFTACKCNSCAILWVPLLVWSGFANKRIWISHIKDSLWSLEHTQSPQAATRRSGGLHAELAFT